MSTPDSPRPYRPHRLAFITIPLAILPLVLAFVPHDSGLMFFVAFGSICVAAPAVGFWLGEIVGRSNDGRAALGCLGSVGLFLFYVVWILFIAPLVSR